MGFDPEKNIFTSQNDCMGRHQLWPTLAELEPGAVGYAEIEHFSLDDTPEQELWAYRNGSVLQMEDVIDHFVDAYHEHDEQPIYVRVARLTAGLLVDQSYTEQTLWRGWGEKHGREGAERVRLQPQLFVPVVFWIFNSVEREELDDAFEAENIILDPDEFDTIEAIFTERIYEDEALAKQFDDDADDEDGLGV